MKRMSGKVKAAVVLLVILAFTLTLALGGCASKTKEATKTTTEQPSGQTSGLNKAVNLKFATFSLGTSWYNYGSAVAQILREKLPAGSMIDVLPYAGGNGNIQLLQEKKADMGLSFDCQYAWAYKGEAIYQQPFKEVRQLVNNMDQYYIAFVALKDYPANSVEEIIQKKMPAKFTCLPEGGSAIIALRQLFKEMNVSESDLKSWGGNITFANAPAALAENVKLKKADVWVQPVPKGHPTLTELATTTDIKLLAVSNENADIMVKNYYYQNVLMPANTFKGQQEVRSIGFTTAIGIRQDMPDDLAYLMAKTIYEARPNLAKLDAGLANFKMEASKVGGCPLHPGAEKYFKEIGVLK